MKTNICGKRIKLDRIVEVVYCLTNRPEMSKVLNSIAVAIESLKIKSF
jgi:hypothetical protein